MITDVIAAIEPGARYPISVARYHQMLDAGVIGERDRVELIEGVIVAVSPQSREHAWVVSELARLLITGLGPEWSVRSQCPLTLARSEPEPDIVVVPRSTVATVARHPETAALVVEVARSSLGLDRAMAATYAEAGVTEYWIVDLDRRQVEVFREPAGAEYLHHTIAGEDVVLQPVALGGIELRVGALFLPRGA